jgi:hypothetical protein
VLGTAEWTLRPIEVNLETLDAGEVLEQIATGQAPAELLAFIPLLHRGGETGIIDRWSELVGAETDQRRRADYALARIFAERAGHPDAWRDALKGFAMIESPLIAELLANAKAETLLHVLRKRYREVPEAVATAVRACKDSAQLDRWLDVALDAPTPEQFRQQGGL